MEDGVRFSRDGVTNPAQMCFSLVDLNIHSTTGVYLNSEPLCFESPEDILGCWP